MKKNFVAGLAVGLMFLSAGDVFASIIWDYSPGTTGAVVSPEGSNGNWSNHSQGQNFAEIVSFATGATITGMDIYSNNYWGSVGQGVVIRLWSDVNGNPDSLLYEINSQISAIDEVGIGSNTEINRKHADFSLTLDAGVDYWIGMSGDGEITLAGLRDVQDDQMAVFGSNTFNSLMYIGDMAFRLEGSTSSTPEPTPEPTTMLLMGAGLAGIVSGRRKKNS